MNGNDELYVPDGNDGYVDYIDESQTAVMSIAIDDEGTTSVLRVGVSVDANVKDVIVGPALGACEGYLLRKADMSEVSEGETGFLLAQFYKDGTTSYAALTQDGRTVITAKLEEISRIGQALLLLDSVTERPVVSTLKLSSSEPSGAVANLPMVKVTLVSYGGQAGGLIQHSPFKYGEDTGYYIMFYTSEGTQIFWGDNASKIYTG